MWVRIAVGLVLLAGLATASSSSAIATEPQAVLLKAPLTPGMIAGRTLVTPSQLAAMGLPPTIQGGIGPGSALLQGVGGPQYLCTASFLLRDPTTATYYLGAAGHCLVRDETDPAPYNGHQDPQKVNDHIEICVSGCLNNGLGLGTYVTLEPSGDYHPVAFAQSGGIGEDFGLIELPADLHDQLRPEMPQWGGPSGADDAATAQYVVHFGHGNICCVLAGVVTRTPADQGRVGLFGGRNGNTIDGYSWITGGDSGSAVSLAELDPAGIAHGTTALGTITHALLGYGPTFSGTRFGHSLDMVETNVHLHLELVAEGDALTQTPTVAPPSFTIDDPKPDQTLKAGDAVAIDGSFAGVTSSGTLRVEVSINDDTFSSPLAGTLTSSSWSASWQTSANNKGAYTVYARLSDDSGVLANAQVSVNVAKDAAPAPAPSPSPSSSAPPGPAPTASAPAPAPPPSAPTPGPSAPSKSSPTAGVALAASLALVAAALRRRRA